MPKELFRLSPTGESTIPPVLFRSDRAGFRFALASAVIDLRIPDGSTPLLLEIGRENNAHISWEAIHDGSRKMPLTLDTHRWEASGLIFDALVQAVRKNGLLAETVRDAEVSPEQANGALGL
jgi:hypothetical protein